LGGGIQAYWYCHCGIELARMDVFLFYRQTETILFEIVTFFASQNGILSSVCNALNAM